MKPTLFIVGGSSTALEIRETVDQFFKDKYFAVYNVISDEEPPILQTYIRDSSLLDRLSTIEVSHYIIGFTNRSLRLRFVDLFGGFNSVLDNVIHPSSYVSPSAILGKGNYLAANAVISSNALIGNSNLINYNVTIGHDVVVGSDCFFNPGARISGNVKIGNGCLFGANSFVFQGLEIKDDCQIDALCYIDRVIEANSMCTSNGGSLRVYRRRY